MLAGELDVEQMLDAAQVAEPLLADVGDEGDRAGGLDAGLLEQPGDAEHHRQTAAVVADARAFQHRAIARHFDVGLFGKHGVEVRGQYQVRARVAAGPLAEDVALLVDADALQLELLEQPLHRLGAALLLERRRRDLADADLLLDEGSLATGYLLQRGGDLGVSRQPRAHVAAGGLHRRRRYPGSPH